MRISKNINNSIAIIVGNSWNCKYLVSGRSGLVPYNKKFVYAIHHSFTNYRDKILKEIL